MTDQGSIDGPLGNFIRFDEPASAKKLADIAEKELHESPQLKEESLQRLKALISKNKVSSITSDDFLLSFLRYGKFDVQRSFQALRNYARHRVQCHENFMNFSPELMKKLLNLKMAGILPYRDSEDRLIYYSRTGVWNPGICSEEELTALGILVCNYALQDPSVQTSGIVALFECSNFGLHSYLALVRKANFLRNYFVNCAPARYQMIHLINEGFFLDYAFRLVKPLIPKKIKERILFHGGTRETLFQHVVPSILPTEFGGNLEIFNNECLMNEMDDYLRKLKDEQRYFLQPKT